MGNDDDVDVDMNMGFFAPVTDVSSEEDDERQAAAYEEQEEQESADAMETDNHPTTTTTTTNKQKPAPKKSILSTSNPTLFHPTLEEIESNTVTILADAYWNSKDAKKAKIQFDSAIVDKIWNEELAKHDFSFRKVMLLEYSQYLEKYLWPSYNRESASITHILSIVLMINEKCRERIAKVWSLFSEDDDDSNRFGDLFHQVLRLLLDEDPTDKKSATTTKSKRQKESPKTSIDIHSLQIKRILVTFLINCFQSLENEVVRSQCVRLVSISIWHNLSTDSRREMVFKSAPQLRKLWNKLEKKFKSSDEETRAKLTFERNFLSRFIVKFLHVLQTIPESGSSSSSPSPPQPHAIEFCERVLELLIDLETQLPTRRAVNTLLHDHQVVHLCSISNLAKREGGQNLFGQLLQILDFYAFFQIDDFTGNALSKEDMERHLYENVARFQRICFVKFRDSLEEIAMANIQTIMTKRDFLKRVLCTISKDELIELCDNVGIRTKSLLVSSREEGTFYSTEFLIDAVVRQYSKRVSQIEKINASPIYPDEKTLFDESVVPGTPFFPNTHCLAIPKLNLQFLTLHDYLLRNYTLLRLDSTYAIRQDVQDVVARMKPKWDNEERKAKFTGWAKMGVGITKFEISEVGQPKIGETKPAFVKAIVTFDTFRMPENLKSEWSSIRPRDILFLLNIHPDPYVMKNDDDQGDATTDFKTKYGVMFIRGCEVLEVLGDDGTPIDFTKSSAELAAGEGEYVRQPSLKRKERTLRVLLDTNQWKLDKENKSFTAANVDPYATFNLLMRRKPSENNFKSVLETIRDLMSQSEIVVPSWLHNVFLGYGDPAEASFTQVAKPLRTIDFGDTFLDWDHLVESFPGRSFDSKKMEPPYVLTFPKSMYEGGEDFDQDVSIGVKRKLGSDIGINDDDDDTIQVRSYKTLNNGPYVDSAPKKNNTIRYTPAQVKAIHAGSSPGLAVIVGPPGTGKTDVAVQILANIYHNNPNQRTLLVTHSNQALNQLFEKLASRNIDPRHLLRLGHGESSLDLEGEWGKYGRVDAFLAKRLELLAEVDRLAETMDIPGAHGSTCETAGYFYTYFIRPTWDEYSLKCLSRESEKSNIIESFPFHLYFHDAPRPLFPTTATTNQIIDIAQGCYRHVKKSFTELEEMRAFEILRTSQDRANYLLMKEAKIIAMTCTHAALKRRELVAVGFKYDNIVMEEAAQMLEVETFIPMLLQSSPEMLKRVVLIGDHHQLPPVVQNMAFQRYGNMEQSLFTRLVRLGVPCIELDKQGRCRSSLADLFRWNYHSLGDLNIINSIINSNINSNNNNPGFAYEYQLVNVDDYMEHGESEPVPYFFQNLGEAEYVVATFQYMRLLGYPAEKITILTTYNGQCDLIQDVVNQRCAWNPLFGTPHKITTVDKYQGQQNDYILLSLVRTKSVGHLRDVRRLIVALSRARLGLYVFCRAKLFQNCYELQPAFSRLLNDNDNKLVVKRDNDEFVIEDVAHMGVYVHQMTRERVEFIKGGGR